MTPEIRNPQVLQAKVQYKRTIVFPKEGILLVKIVEGIMENEIICLELNAVILHCLVMYSPCVVLRRIVPYYPQNQDIPFVKHSQTRVVTHRKRKRQREKREEERKKKEGRKEEKKTN